MRCPQRGRPATLMTCILVAYSSTFLPFVTGFLFYSSPCRLLPIVLHLRLNFFKRSDTCSCSRKGAIDCPLTSLMLSRDIAVNLATAAECFLTENVASTIKQFHFQSPHVFHGSSFLETANVVWIVVLWKTCVA